MTSERKAAANRANAGRSTGPRTATGKRASSRNATRHGLTARPDQVDVLRWYRVIREDPVAELPSFPATDSERAALHLAEAEARLERARTAEAEHLVTLVDCMQRRGRRSLEDLSGMDVEEGLEDVDFLDTLIANLRGDPAMARALRIIRRSSPSRPAALHRRMQTLRGYRQRAEGQRRQALKTWLRLQDQKCETKPNTRVG